MERGDAPLSGIIRDEIGEAGGRVTFRRFMELALYEPDHGYYSSGRAMTGRKGDFLTNVSVGAVYGGLMARHFAGVWERMGRPTKFRIVEQGANDGMFARDVLAAVEGHPVTEALRYVIVEPFSALENRQRGTLERWSGRVEWKRGIAELEPFEGIHFSNELVDAFPVHLVTRRNSDWQERYVTADGERFIFEEGPLSDPRVEARLAGLGEAFPEGYLTEANLEMEEWIGAVAEKLRRGRVLTVDYGFPREVFYQAERTAGTLACYARHRRGDDPLSNPGEQDLTAHVDFTSLAEAAERSGLESVGFTDQHHFLTELVAQGGWAGAEEEWGKPEWLRQFKMLMHPELMGAQFKVIAFEKGIGG